MGQVFYPYLLEKVDRDFFIVSIRVFLFWGILYHPSFAWLMDDVNDRILSFNVGMMCSD